MSLSDGNLNGKEASKGQVENAPQPSLEKDMVGKRQITRTDKRTKHFMFKRKYVDKCITLSDVLISVSPQAR